ncbi:putative bifunctional diguanylate cyclase/phosphodiesterase [Methylocystis bryophila]|uniref:GGDEF-domain containing protein n=1 Tax=Methylocystis bryophila TaxID=655015 RepID=A0A1W6MRF5_9HYPH|nr:bifunctional diguanylate cyclase/phosphodiesterase [Methylocystis bryophila]ARN80157.1 GGDEF-domain containing protein [Methylocystis bryophila]BDV40098.1 GGDEF-domain containing protein [Methylocystis bryophila]
MQLRHPTLHGASVWGDEEFLLPPRVGVASPAPPPPTVVPHIETVLNSIGELVYVWDLVTDRISWTGDLPRTLGSLGEVDLSSGIAFGDRVSPESVVSRYEAIVKSDHRDEGDGVPYQLVYGLLQPRELGISGSVWVEDTGRWYGGADGRPARAQGVLRVVTERHNAERLRARHAHIDSLTGLLNRSHLSEKLQRLIEAAERSRKPFALLLVGLENLFALNRNYGYDAGDEVIAGLARRLCANMRASDLLARHAGNKIAIVAPECDLEQMQSIAMRLIDCVAAEPFETKAGAVPATIRVGGVIGPRHGRSSQMLFQHAEEALDAARESSSARFSAFSPSLARGHQRMQALSVAESIVSALDENRVELALQPIVRAKDGEAAFYEALLRVRLGDGSLVTPGSILPVAEKAGLVRLLDRRVLDLALEKMSADPRLRLSVNASLSTLLDPEWPDRLARALEMRQGVAERLTIEITETSMIEDIETTGHVVASCKRLGIKMAMDDFGSGHTSFRNLRAMAFDLVKIDGAFIRNIVNSEDDRFFARTLTALAHHLKLEIVAEWVEDEATAAMLREWGVDYFQGAFFGSAEG